MTDDDIFKLARLLAVREHAAMLKGAELALEAWEDYVTQGPMTPVAHWPLDAARIVSAWEEAQRG